MRHALRILMPLSALASIVIACGDRFAKVEVTNRCATTITAVVSGEEVVLRPGDSTRLRVNAPDESGVEIEVEITSESAPDWRRSLVLTNGSGLIVAGSGCPE